MASGKGILDDDDRHTWFRVKMTGSRGNTGSTGSGISGSWSKGWGGARGAVRMPPPSRLSHVGKSAGKVASVSMRDSQQRCMTKLAYHKMSHASTHVAYLEREGAGLERNAAQDHLGYLERDAGGLIMGARNRSVPARGRRSTPRRRSRGGPVSTISTIGGWSLPRRRRRSHCRT